MRHQYYQTLRLLSSGNDISTSNTLELALYLFSTFGWAQKHSVTDRMVARDFQMRAFLFVFNVRGNLCIPFAEIFMSYVSVDGQNLAPIAIENNGFFSRVLPTTVLRHHARHISHNTVSESLLLCLEMDKETTVESRWWCRQGSPTEDALFGLMGDLTQGTRDREAMSVIMLQTIVSGPPVLCLTRRAKKGTSAALRTGGTSNLTDERAVIVDLARNAGLTKDSPKEVFINTAFACILPWRQ
ncbi:uncharacterized protein ARMOST_22448 [Armillaria ostoyae]|uniref:Uncharacterized protein n=1 Tax=Armillaria ostoyae TaxID=47428 RepID=A0A284SCY0_ARMOS|nr:uncharacterized protein ARMOST_22448 [Armillaria ostoyae]